MTYAYLSSWLALRNKGCICLAHIPLLPIAEIFVADLYTNLQRTAREDKRKESHFMEKSFSLLFLVIPFRKRNF